MQRLTAWMDKPYQKMMRDHPHMAMQQPFQYVAAALTQRVRSDSA